MPAPTLLVLRALALGDLLVAVPALRALRRAHPGHRVLLATAGSLAPLALASGAVDEVLPVTSPADLPTSPSGPPDVAVNLHGAGPQSHRALDATRPSHRIGFRCAGVDGWTGPTYAEAFARHPHERALWCALLEHHGIPADPDDLRLPPPGLGAPVIVVHPGAAFGAKRWPAGRFAAVARSLERRAPVVLTGTAPERELALEVAAAAGLPAERVLAGRTSLTELCTVVAGAVLVVCGDTGVAHVASAYGTPSVVLFGPVGPGRWGPPPGPHRSLTHAELRRGDRFGEEPDPALTAIGIDEVLAAAALVLDGDGPGAGQRAAAPTGTDART